jgi:biotin carboxyl carrier protein
MRVVLERAGKKEEVEVAFDLSSVTVGGHRYPVTVVSTQPNRVELEVDGEKAVVENWPDHFPQPFGPVDVNGERWSVGVETAGAEPGASSLIAASSSTPAVSSPPPPAGAPASRESAEGVPVIPSMPGRVLEVRVAEGDHVVQGQTLLVLEAMKMRGEVPSPVEGTVHGLRVTPGANARAKEPMMWVRPKDGGR